MSSPFEAGSPLAHEYPTGDGSYENHHFDNYQPAPFNIIGEDADHFLVERQRFMAEKFANAAHGELDGRVKAPIVSFVIHSIKNRMQSREGQNAAAHITRLYKEPQLDFDQTHTAGDILEAIEAAKHGEASVLQGEFARRALGMSSIEYANLTTIGSFRSELEMPMWDDVGKLLGHDARALNGDDFYAVRPLAFDRSLKDAQHIGAIRVGAKRELGTLDDGTIVKARTALVLDTSYASDFDKDALKEILTVGRAAENSKDKKAPSAEEQIAQLPAFQEAVRRHLFHSHTDTVLARNDTIYGYNKKTADEYRLLKSL